MLVDIRYSQNIVFGFEKKINQNNSPSVSHPPNKNILPQQNF